MRELERFAAVRTRKGESYATKNFEFTGKFLYAQYHHANSRMLDPQLHTHNVIANVTQERDGSFKALDLSQMFKATVLFFPCGCAAVFTFQLAFFSCGKNTISQILDWWYDDLLTAAEIQRRLKAEGLDVARTTVMRFIKVREQRASKRKRPAALRKKNTISAEHPVIPPPSQTQSSRNGWWSQAVFWPATILSKQYKITTILHSHSWYQAVTILHLKYSVAIICHKK